MLDNDAVVEAPYCVVCRRSSSVKWQKHVFSRGHQQKSHHFLQQQVARLLTLCNDIPAATDWWRCVFCDVAVAIADVPVHFGSEAHRKKVETFCRHYRCDADHRTRPQLWLDTSRCRQLEAALRQRTESAKEQAKQPKKVEETKDQATTKRVEAFLSSAAIRLAQVEGKKRKAEKETSFGARAPQEVPHEALYGPQLAVATSAKRCKPVTSLEGVMQHPLGRHEGKRVWGGGIATLRTTDWVPWAIDRLVQDEQNGQLEAHRMGRGHTSFVHRMTEVAHGEGLGSIAPVGWGSSVGNVHTAAVPPWMVQTEEEYKQCNRREQAASPPKPTERNDQGDVKSKKRSDIFSELRTKSEYDPGWLPNFGGVWQEGPRSKTKQAFRKAAAGPKPLRSQAHSRPAISTAFLLNAQDVPSEKTEPPVPPVPAFVKILSTEQSEISSSEHVTSLNSEETKFRPTSTIDAKKQLLLAQKERLRAKMAASRRK